MPHNPLVSVPMLTIVETSALGATLKAAAKVRRIKP
jgi:hypothetical protein